MKSQLFVYTICLLYSVILWLSKKQRKQRKDPCLKLQTTAQEVVESDFPCWIIHRPHLPQNSPLMLWVGVQHHLLNSPLMGPHLHHILLHHHNNNIKIRKCGVTEERTIHRNHNLAIILVTITEINVFAFKKKSKILLIIW